VTIEHIVVVEKIGRISIDGEVNGKKAAVVFMSSEVPAKVQTEDQMNQYMQDRLRASVEDKQSGQIASPKLE